MNTPATTNDKRARSAIDKAHADTVAAIARGETVRDSHTGQPIAKGEDFITFILPARRPVSR